MELEELRVIWDRQEEKPMYAIDTDALHRMVRRRGRAIERRFRALDYVYLGTLALLALSHAVDPVLRGADYGNLWYVAIFVACGGIALWEIRRRNEQFERFEPTLRGDIEKALAQIDRQILLQQRAVKWSLVPALLVSAAMFAWLFDPAPLWIWPAISLGGAAIWWTVQRDLQRQAARKRELDALREKLADDLE